MLQKDVVLQGRYVIEESLGRGGMGTVYLARDLTLGGKKVAIKQMVVSIPDPDERERAAQQFEREARLLASLDHPGLVDVTHYFEEGGNHYLVMAYIQGQTLKEYLASLPGLPSVQHVVEWADFLCDVLEYLHSQTPAVLFRDLKPANVMRDHRGHLHLIDFGIARELKDVTSTFIRGTGTPGYCPVEQYGNNTGTDQRSDIYSLGATLYTLLTRLTPPAAVDLLTGDALVYSIRHYNPQVPIELENVIARMMAIKRDDRYHNIKEVRAALAAASRSLWNTDQAVCWNCGTWLPVTARTCPGCGNVARPPAGVGASYAPPIPQVASAPSASIPAAPVPVAPDPTSPTWMPTLPPASAPAAYAYPPAGPAYSAPMSTPVPAPAPPRPASSGPPSYAGRPQMPPTTAPAPANPLPPTSLPPVPPQVDTRRRAPGNALNPGGASPTVGPPVPTVSTSPTPVPPAPQPVNTAGRRVIPPTPVVPNTSAASRGAPDGAPEKERAVLNGHQGCVWSVAVSPDGRLVASGADDATVRLWDPGNNQQVRKIKCGSIVHCVGFGKDGRVLAWGTADGVVFVSPTFERGEPMALKAHSSNVQTLAWSPDGRLLATGSQDRAILIWAGGKQIKDIRTHTAQVTALAFSPDGSRLVSGSADRSVRLWDPGTGKEMVRYKGHNGFVWSVAFTKDGRHLLTASDDRTIRLWEVASGKEIEVFTHWASLNSIALSPDGRLLASGASDKTVCLWDIQLSRVVRYFEGHQHYVQCVAFTPDGKTLVSSSGDGTIRLWNV
ncbi:MAG: protein kinase domain-containing protein [Candidatus Xenobia bacterium]